MINPILDWTDDEVWKFLHFYGCRSNPLYECGHTRIGCVGCPMAKKTARIVGLKKYYYQAYLTAFDNMLKKNAEKGLKCSWKSAEEVMKWWLHGDIDQNQMLFDGFDLLDI